MSESISCGYIITFCLPCSGPLCKLPTQNISCTTLELIKTLSVVLADHMPVAHLGTEADKE